MSRKFPTDPRPFVRIATDIFFNEKLNEIDNAGASWTYLTSIVMSAQNMTDGRIQPAIAQRMAGTSGTMVILRGQQMSITDALVEQNLWHLPGHECERCEQPPPGAVLIHDYLSHQQSAQDRADYTAWKSRAGKAGADSRWGKKNNPAPVADAMAAAIPAAMAAANQPGNQPGTEPGTAAALADTERRLAAEQPVPPPRPATTRRTRLPETFPLTPQMRMWANRSCPEVNVEFEHERFLTHYRGVGEPRGDWNSVWKDWMLREHKYANRPRPARTPVYSNGTDPAEALRREEHARG